MSKDSNGDRRARSRYRRFIGVLLCSFGLGVLSAQIFGTLRGSVHDPQQAPMMGAKVTVKARGSALVQQTQTDERGEFALTAVPAGLYTISIEQAEFRTISQELQVAIGSAPVLDFTMEMAAAVTSVDVA